MRILGKRTDVSVLDSAIGGGSVGHPLGCGRTAGSITEQEEQQKSTEGMEWWACYSSRRTKLGS